jgi:hypothetical protein
MSNGDSLDGFVFPPFIPPAAAARPVDPPAAPPAPAVRDEPPAEPQTASGRMTMPWDVETPIVSEQTDAATQAAATDEDEDLPWLERPEPRAEAEAPAAPAVVAAPQDEAFPDWLAWDDRATDEARPETETVARVEGLEDFAPVDDQAGFVAPEPAVEWTAAAPPVDAVADLEPDWSLDAPEAVEPPSVAQAAPELTFESPDAAAAAEPTFEVTVDDGALTFAPAESPDEPVAAEAPVAEAEAADEPSSVFAEEPAAATEESALPADPFIADTEAVLSAEPEPFTAAVQEAEAAAPVDAASAGTATNGVFADVAGRLEEIARTLRDRPEDLLSGAASDPLALLVAGYVMGYGARR